MSLHHSKDLKYKIVSETGVHGYKEIAFSILKACEENKTDIVVLGSRRGEKEEKVRAYLLEIDMTLSHSQTHLGSVSSRVFNKSHLPILVIPLKKEEEKKEVK
jgi:nucleotide-binding universal stress UspA family protein